MAKRTPTTQTRVLENTAEQINERLRREMEARVLYFAQYPDEIDGRLQELAQEWDIERVLEANAAGLSLFGILMARRSRRWLAMPFGVAAFLLLHAVQGWCPPVPMFRRLGVRTVREINEERQALRVLKGDFDDVDLSNLKNPQDKAEKALDAAVADSD